MTNTRQALAGAVLTFVVLLAVVLRVVHVRDLVASPWVDGYHHTLIAQMFIDAGGIPSGFRPYLPVDRFYYHFGFHSLAAIGSWLTAATARLSVLWTGQALNAAAVLTVYALARRCVDRPIAAVAAAAVPATMYWFPSYFASWGRNTQLAGLVVLPVAWLLLLDASSQRRARLIALAGFVAAGLLLVHYRVFVFFLIGGLVLAVGSLLAQDRRRLRLLSMCASGAVAGVLVAPWLAGELASGARALESTSVEWLGGPSGVGDVPTWLFTTGLNGLLILVAVRGTVVGLARRRLAAAAVAVTCALALAAVDPRWIGATASWALPPFSLAIGVYLPVAIGIALLVDALLDATEPIFGRRSAEVGAAVLVAAAALYGASVTREIVNTETIIITQADVDAASWIEDNTPADSKFLVSSAHWHLGTHRGLDGGYWLPLLAGRDTTMPASFYNYGEADYAREVLHLAERIAPGNDLSDDELVDIMNVSGSDYVYVGPAAEGKAGKFSADRLQRLARLEEVYSREGVYVYRLRSGD